MGLAAAGGSGGAVAGSGAPTTPDKLRSDLAALVSGAARLDPRIPPLVAGYRTAEIPHFAVLSEPNDSAHEPS